MHAKFIEHQGVPVVYIDLSGIRTEQDALDRIASARSLIGAQAPGAVLTFTDCNDSVIGRAGTDALREYTKHNKPFVRAAALIGITGLQKVILSVISKFSGRSFRICKTRTEALDWLVRQL